MKTTVDHTALMEQMFTVCRMAIMVDPEDLAELGNQFAYEDTMGPLRNTTQYMTLAEKLQNAKKTFNAFATFHREIRRIEADERARVAKERQRER